MASDDPAGHARVELPVRFDDASDLEGVQSHLNSLRKHRHFTPIASTANPPATSNSHKIYLERIRAERDTVDQDWFDSDPLVIEPTRSAPGSSRDRLRHVEHAVKLNVRRAGTKATDTLRKTKRSLFSSSRPKITLNDDIPLEAKADQDGLTSGVAIRPQRTNSTFNTITLPAFDSLARYRSTSSRSTLSSSNVDLASLPRARPRSPQSPGRGAPRVASPSSLSSVRNFDSYFPSSPPMHVQSDPASSLPPLSTATTRNNDEPSHPHRRTLTIDDYSPPSRRDTLASFLPSRHHPSSGPISGLFFNHHNKHALQTTTNSSSTSVSSASRPTTPPPAPSRGGKGVLTRSPTELTTMTTHTNSQKTRRRVAKEELQKLLLRRKKLLSRRARDDVDDENRILVPGEGDEETEGAKGAAGTKGIDKEIVERLKVLGALVEETERVETDVLWEHQRGLLVFGLPKFSSAALFQFDPSVWTDETLRSSPYTPHDFPCRPYWRWRDQEFMVDMGGDRDEEGWSYAVFFHSKNWRGEPSLFRSFVRRRRWVRTRIYIPLPPSNSSDPASSSSPLSLSTDPSSKRDSHRGGGRPTGEKFLAIDGTIAQDQEERDDDEVEVKDLKSACECLPLTREEKMALFYSATCSTSNSSSTLDGGLRGTKKARQLESVYIPPENPFIPFRIILEHARLRDHDVDEGDNECHEPGTADKRNQPGRELVWRQGIREINETRVKQVLKRVARIDRERLKLWKIWLNAPADPRRDVDDAEDDTAREKGFECQEWSEWRSSEKVTSWTEWLEEHRPEELRNEDDGEDDGRKMSWRIKEEVGEDVPPVESEDFASVNRADRSRGPEAGKSRPSSRQSRDGTGNRRGLDEEDEDVGRPDLEDVWDLIEARLDNVLALFDYHLTRLAFLRLVLACHPLASTPFPSSASSSSTQPSIRHDKDARQFVHRHEGYDLPFEARRHKLELEWEKRLRWVAGVKEEVERMEGGRGNSPPSPARTAAGGRVLELKKDENALQRTRSERRARKGKQRAIYVEG